jgi:hypothetical protein
VLLRAKLIENTIFRVLYQNLFKLELALSNMKQTKLAQRLLFLLNNLNLVNAQTDSGAPHSEGAM